MTVKSIVFPCGDIQLEGVLSTPAGKSNSPAVVVCHPHPLYGGDMNNNVVMSICAALVKNAIACLRFNFRGVGESGGRYGEGLAEQDDAKAAIDFLSSLPEIDSQRIGLAGYSFGGMVTLPVALSDNRVKSLALISPAIKEADRARLKDYSHPKLIVVGDADTSVPFQPFRKYFTDARQYQIIAGADHFWWGNEDELSGRVAQFFSKNL